jgi:hypothetical protein
MKKGNRWIGLLEFQRVVPEVIDALGEVKDFRGRKGRRYELWSLLALVVIGLAAGFNSLAQIARYGKRRKGLLRQLGMKGAPSHATLWRAVTHVKGGQLRKALGRVGGKLLQERYRRVVAVDGKTMRGSRGTGGQATQTVAICEHASGAAIDSVEIRKGQSELGTSRKAVKALLKSKPQVRVVTGDALYADEVLVADISKAGRDYVVKLKKIRLGCGRK